MKNFLEMLRELRAVHCRLSVAYHLQDLDRAKAGLAKSFAALDAAEAELAIHEHDARPTIAPPLYLTKGPK